MWFGPQEYSLQPQFMFNLGVYWSVQALAPSAVTVVAVAVAAGATAICNRNLHQQPATPAAKISLQCIVWCNASWQKDGAEIP